MISFEELYNTYFQDVFRHLRGLTANEQLAEELTAETFFKALHSIQNFHGNCDIRVWLCQIGKNTYYSYLKKERKQLNTEDSQKSFQEITQEGFEQLLVDKEMAFLLHQILHSIAEPYKEVFSLRIFGELSFKQIGMIFGKTEHWACVTYHRAKAKIQQEMEASYE